MALRIEFMIHFFSKDRQRSVCDPSEMNWCFVELGLGTGKSELSGRMNWNFTRLASSSMENLSSFIMNLCYHLQVRKKTWALPSWKTIAKTAQKNRVFMLHCEYVRWSRSRGYPLLSKSTTVINKKRWRHKLLTHSCSGRRRQCNIISVRLYRRSLHRVPRTALSLSKISMSKEKSLIYLMEQRTKCAEEWRWSTPWLGVTYARIQFF